MRSLVELSQLSMSPESSSRRDDDTLWAVVFDGRIRVSVSAPDADSAVSQARVLMPGRVVMKVYPR